MYQEPEEPPLQAEKANPRKPWEVCGRCWCVVADLDQHTAACYPAATGTEDTTEGTT